MTEREKLIEALETVLGLAEVGDEHEDNEARAIEIVQQHIDELKDRHGDVELARRSHFLDRIADDNVGRCLAVASLGAREFDITQQVGYRGPLRAPRSGDPMDDFGDV